MAGRAPLAFRSFPNARTFPIPNIEGARTPDLLAELVLATEI